MTGLPDLAFLATPPPLAGLALGLVALWLVLACLVALLPRRWRPRAVWMLVLAGVPALGWVTLLWGPGIGVAGLGLGLLILLGRPAAHRHPPASGSRPSSAPLTDGSEGPP